MLVLVLGFRIQGQMVQQLAGMEDRKIDQISSEISHLLYATHLLRKVGDGNIMKDMTQKDRDNLLDLLQRRGLSVFCQKLHSEMNAQLHTLIVEFKKTSKKYPFPKR